MQQLEAYNFGKLSEAVLSPDYSRDRFLAS